MPSPVLSSSPMPDISVKTVPVQGLSSRSQALLQVTESIAQHRDLAELFRDLAARLHDVAHFDYLNLVLHDPERQVMRLHLLEALREKPTQSRVGRESPVGSTPSGRVFETQGPFVVPDVDSEKSFPAADGGASAGGGPVLLRGSLDHGAAQAGNDGLRKA